MEDSASKNHGAAVTDEAKRENEQLQEQTGGRDKTITIDDLHKSKNFDKQSKWVFHNQLRMLVAEEKRKLEEVKAKRAHTKRTNRSVERRYSGT
ncbi:hypothetical protein PV05_11751 [Exophiala xenobiotica]|uniref:Uncharacterized protein n=1 Tax=Exophiala xenobiotica TaxID=348802 RepID=A0A0D2E5Y0_9EURO|nr:uncharacterized protein PV05_11751 [Exophiala xenobiotica]KIW50135.1 hypothetical protein PV05_11751 [Exophiala xenobiotica]